MKSDKIFWKIFCLLIVSSCQAQKNLKPVETPMKLEKTLLWEISGNGLEKHSYIYGTIHRICKEEAHLSDSLQSVIESSDQVYFEVDMDNVIEMLGIIRMMKMKNDTTLADLLSKDDYEKLKTWFEGRNTMLPFSVLETYKPMLAASTIMESGLSCEGVAMEQLIMTEARKEGKRIKGLESMAYQMSLFDSIPYKTQAEELLKYIETDKGESDGDKEYEELMKAYRDQDLDKLGELITRSEMATPRFEELLLTNRNRNWVHKMKTLLPGKSLLFAVGAGHLPGVNGVINLLRKEGYKVRAVKNKITKQSQI